MLFQTVLCYLSQSIIKFQIFINLPILKNTSHLTILIKININMSRRVSKGGKLNKKSIKDDDSDFSDDLDFSLDLES